MPETWHRHHRILRRTETGHSQSQNPHRIASSPHSKRTKNARGLELTLMVPRWASAAQWVPCFAQVPGADRLATSLKPSWKECILHKPFEDLRLGRFFYVLRACDAVLSGLAGSEEVPETSAFPWGSRTVQMTSSIRGAVLAAQLRRGYCTAGNAGGDLRSRQDKALVIPMLPGSSQTSSMLPSVLSQSHDSPLPRPRQPRFALRPGGRSHPPNPPAGQPGQCNNEFGPWWSVCACVGMSAESYLEPARAPPTLRT